MHSFFADRAGVIAGDEAIHLGRVLRLSPGDEIEVLLDGRRYLAMLNQVKKDEAGYTVIKELPSHEPGLRVTLYQGLCKGERMEFIAQKCTEMGIYKIVPVLMERTEVKPHSGNKLQRLSRIAREAVKQCGRARVPEIAEPKSFADCLLQMKAHESLIMPYEEGGEAIKSEMAAGSDIGILIGPEGGIAPQEAKAMGDMGASIITLGSRILRTETAGLVTLTLLMHLAGELEGTP